MSPPVRADLDSYLAALVWLLFYSEFEWWGQKYKPSEEVCLSNWPWTAPVADLHQMRRHAANLFGVLDPDKRHERRKDAPETSAPTEVPESKSK